MIGRIGRKGSWEEWELGGMGIGRNGNWEMEDHTGDHTRIHFQLSNVKITSVFLLKSSKSEIIQTSSTLENFLLSSHPCTIAWLSAELIVLVLTSPWLKHLFMTDYSNRTLLPSMQLPSNAFHGTWASLATLFLVLNLTSNTPVHHSSPHLQVFLKSAPCTREPEICHRVFNTT